MQRELAGLHRPSWAVVASGDKPAGADVVLSMAKRAGATITELEGSHVIMVSQPEAVTNMIMEAVRALTQVPVGAGDVSPDRSGTATRHRQPDRRRPAERRLPRPRPGRRARGGPAARLAVRHPQLCGRGPAADRSGIPRDRPLSPRIRHNPFPLRRHSP